MLDSYWFKPAKVRQQMTASDPTQGLTSYFQEVKPYHTKLLEVAIKHTYQESIKVRCGESLHIKAKLHNRYWETVTYQCNSGYDLDYGYGYGMVWMGGWGGDTNDLPTEPRPPMVSDVEFDEAYDTTGFDGQLNPIISGDIPHITTINANIVQAISNDRDDLPANTFLIDPPESEIYAFIMTDLESSTFGLVEPFDIIGNDPLRRVWKLKGNQVAKFSPGLEFYVNASSRLRYTVATATLRDDGDTEVLTNETISLNSRSEGTAGILIPKRAYPWWPTGMRIRMIETKANQGVSGNFYFRPIVDSNGLFNLSETETGPNYQLSDVPTERLMMHNLESFMTGMRLVVTHGEDNDGTYVIYKTAVEDGKVRVWIIGNINTTKLENAGIANYDTSNGLIQSEFCRLIDSDPLYIRSLVHENLKITIDTPQPPTGMLVTKVQTGSGIASVAVRLRSSTYATEAFVLLYDSDSVLLNTIQIPNTDMVEVPLSRSTAYLVIDQLNGPSPVQVDVAGPALVGVHSWEHGHSMWVGMSTNIGNTTSPNFSLVPSFIPDSFKSLDYMFMNATIFNNRNVERWNTSNIISMVSTFRGARHFNCDISSWNVSNVVSLQSTFMDAASFNQDISNWDVSSNTTFDSTFRDAINFDQPIGKWDISNAITLYSMLRDAKAFNQPVADWELSRVVNVGSLFRGCTKFNQNIDNWQVSLVTDMSYMLASCANFTYSLKDWDTSNVKDMTGMFQRAEKFNGDISNWNTNKLTQCSYMFQRASAFDQPIGRWNVSKVQNFEYMFDRATKFNQPLNDWDMSRATILNFMFQFAVNFNQDLNSWNTSNVTTMNATFGDCSKFNGDITNWNTSKVTNMFRLFSHTPFDRDISNWDVSKVTTMSWMFQNATMFNQPIGKWNVSSVVDMNGMFMLTEKFNQDLSSWCVANISTQPDNFDNENHIWTQPKPVWGTCP